MEQMKDNYILLYKEHERKISRKRGHLGYEFVLSANKSMKWSMKRFMGVSCWLC